MLNFLFQKTPLVFMTQSLWRDEGFSYQMARVGLVEMIKTTARDFNPPFYYGLLHFWIKLFGASEVMLRSLSLLFFAINIYVFYIFLENIFKIKNKRLWCYVLLFSANPLLLYYSMEARMYSLFALLTTLSFYFFLKADSKKLTLINIIGLYTHYYFIFVILTQILHTFYHEKKPHLKKIKPQIIAIMGFIPWFLVILPTIATKTRDTWIFKTDVLRISMSLATLLTGYEHNFYKFFHMLAPFVSLGLLAFVIYFATRQREKNRLFSLLILWSFLFYFVTLIISFVWAIFVPRYLIFATVGFNFLLIYMLERTPKNLRLIILAFLFLTIFYYTKLEIKHRLKADARTQFAKIRELATPDDYLYVLKPTEYFTAIYYFDYNRVYVLRREREIVPYYLGAALIPQSKIVSKFPTYPKKAFVIIDDRFNYEVKSQL